MDYKLLDPFQPPEDEKKKVEYIEWWLANQRSRYNFLVKEYNQPVQKPEIFANRREIKSDIDLFSGLSNQYSQYKRQFQRTEVDSTYDAVLPVDGLSPEHRQQIYDANKLAQKKADALRRVDTRTRRAGFTQTYIKDGNGLITGVIQRVPYIDKKDKDLSNLGQQANEVSAWRKVKIGGKEYLERKYYVFEDESPAVSDTLDSSMRHFFGYKKQDGTEVPGILTAQNEELRKLHDETINSSVKGRVKTWLHNQVDPNSTFYRYVTAFDDAIVDTFGTFLVQVPLAVGDIFTKVFTMPSGDQLFDAMAWSNWAKRDWFQMSRTEAMGGALATQRWYEIAPPKSGGEAIFRTVLDGAGRLASYATLVAALNIGGAGAVATDALSVVEATAAASTKVSFAQVASMMSGVEAFYGSLNQVYYEPELRLLDWANAAAKGIFHTMATYALYTGKIPFMDKAPVKGQWVPKGYLPAEGLQMLPRAELVKELTKTAKDVVMDTLKTSLVKNPLRFAAISEVQGMVDLGVDLATGRAKWRDVEEYMGGIFRRGISNYLTGVAWQLPALVGGLNDARNLAKLQRDIKQYASIVVPQEAAENIINAMISHLEAFFKSQQMDGKVYNDLKTELMTLGGDRMLRTFSGQAEFTPMDIEYMTAMYAKVLTASINLAQAGRLQEAGLLMHIFNLAMFDANQLAYSYIMGTEHVRGGNYVNKVGDHPQQADFQPRWNPKTQSMELGYRGNQSSHPIKMKLTKEARAQLNTVQGIMLHGGYMEDVIWQMALHARNDVVIEPTTTLALYRSDNPEPRPPSQWAGKTPLLPPPGGGGGGAAQQPPAPESRPSGGSTPTGGGQAPVATDKTPEQQSADKIYDRQRNGESKSLTKENRKILNTLWSAIDRRTNHNKEESETVKNDVIFELTRETRGKGNEVTSTKLLTPEEWAKLREWLGGERLNPETIPDVLNSIIDNAKHEFRQGRRTIETPETTTTESQIPEQPKSKPEPKPEPKKVLTDTETPISGGGAPIPKPEPEAKRAETTEPQMQKEPPKKSKLFPFKIPDNKEQQDEELQKLLDLHKKGRQQIVVLRPDGTKFRQDILGRTNEIFKARGSEPITIPPKQKTSNDALRERKNIYRLRKRKNSPENVVLRKNGKYVNIPLNDKKKINDLIDKGWEVDIDSSVSAMTEAQTRPVEPVPEKKVEQKPESAPDKKANVKTESGVAEPKTIKDKLHKLTTVSEKDFKDNPPEGFRYETTKRGDETIAYYDTDGRIVLTDNFFGQSPETKLDVLNHELAHGTTDELIFKNTDKFWELVDSGLFGKFDKEMMKWAPASGLSGRNPNESITEALSQYRQDPVAFQENYGKKAAGFMQSIDSEKPIKQTSKKTKIKGSLLEPEQAPTELKQQNIMHNENRLASLKNKIMDYIKRGEKVPPSLYDEYDRISNKLDELKGVILETPKATQAPTVEPEPAPVSEKAKKTKPVATSKEATAKETTKKAAKETTDDKKLNKKKVAEFVRQYEHLDTNKLLSTWVKMRKAAAEPDASNDVIHAFEAVDQIKRSRETGATMVVEDSDYSDRAGKEDRVRLERAKMISETGLAGMELSKAMLNNMLARAGFSQQYADNLTLMYDQLVESFQELFPDSSIGRGTITDWLQDMFYYDERVNGLNRAEFLTEVFGKLRALGANIPEDKRRYQFDESSDDDDAVDFEPIFDKDDINDMDYSKARILQEDERIKYKFRQIQKDKKYRKFFPNGNLDIDKLVEMRSPVVMRIIDNYEAGLDKEIVEYYISVFSDVYTGRQRYLTQREAELVIRSLYHPHGNKLALEVIKEYKPNQLNYDDPTSYVFYCFTEANIVWPANLINYYLEVHKKEASENRNAMLQPFISVDKRNYHDLESINVYSGFVPYYPDSVDEYIFSNMSVVPIRNTYLAMLSRLTDMSPARADKYVSYELQHILLRSTNEVVYFLHDIGLNMIVDKYIEIAEYLQSVKERFQSGFVEGVWDDGDDDFYMQVSLLDDEHAARYLYVYRKAMLHDAKSRTNNQQYLMKIMRALEGGSFQVIDTGSKTFDELRNILFYFHSYEEIYRHGVNLRVSTYNIPFSVFERCANNTQRYITFRGWSAVKAFQDTGELLYKLIRNYGADLVPYDERRRFFNSIFKDDVYLDIIEDRAVEIGEFLFNNPEFINHQAVSIPAISCLLCYIALAPDSRIPIAIEQEMIPAYYLADPIIRMEGLNSTDRERINNVLDQIKMHKAESSGDVEMIRKTLVDIVNVSIHSRGLLLSKTTKDFWERYREQFTLEDFHKLTGRRVFGANSRRDLYESDVKQVIEYLFNKYRDKILKPEHPTEGQKQTLSNMLLARLITLEDLGQARLQELVKERLRIAKVAVLLSRAGVDDISYNILLEAFKKGIIDENGQKVGINVALDIVKMVIGNEYGKFKQKPDQVFTRISDWEEYANTLKNGTIFVPPVISQIGGGVQTFSGWDYTMYMISEPLYRGLDFVSVPHIYNQIMSVHPAGEAFSTLVYADEIEGGNRNYQLNMHGKDVVFITEIQADFVQQHANEIKWDFTEVLRRNGASDERMKEFERQWQYYANNWMQMMAQQLIRHHLRKGFKKIYLLTGESVNAQLNANLAQSTADHVYNRVAPSVFKCDRERKTIRLRLEDGDQREFTVWEFAGDPDVYAFESAGDNEHDQRKHTLRGVTVAMQNRQKIAMSLTKNATIKTLPHELAHVMLFWLERAAVTDRRAYVTLKAIADWLGVPIDNIDHAAQEKFAKHFEKLLFDGVRAHGRVGQMFNYLAQQFRKTWDTMHDTPDFKLPKHVRDIYEMLMGLKTFEQVFPREAKQIKKEFELHRGKLRGRSPPMDMLVDLQPELKFVDAKESGFSVLHKDSGAYFEVEENKIDKTLTIDGVLCETGDDVLRQVSRIIAAQRRDWHSYGRAFRSRGNDVMAVFEAEFEERNSVQAQHRKALMALRNEVSKNVDLGSFRSALQNLIQLTIMRNYKLDNVASGAGFARYQSILRGLCGYENIGDCTTLELMDLLEAVMPGASEAYFSSPFFKMLTPVAEAVAQEFGSQDSQTMEQVLTALLDMTHNYAGDSNSLSRFVQSFVNPISNMISILGYQGKVLMEKGAEAHLNHNRMLAHGAKIIGDIVDLFKNKDNRNKLGTQYMLFRQEQLGDIVIQAIENNDAGNAREKYVRDKAAVHNQKVDPAKGIYEVNADDAIAVMHKLEELYDYYEEWINWLNDTMEEDVIGVVQQRYAPRAMMNMPDFEGANILDEGGLIDSRVVDAIKLGRPAHAKERTRKELGGTYKTDVLGIAKNYVQWMSKFIAYYGLVDYVNNELPLAAKQNTNWKPFVTKWMGSMIDPSTPIVGLDKFVQATRTFVTTAGLAYNWPIVAQNAMQRALTIKYVGKKAYKLTSKIINILNGKLYKPGKWKHLNELLEILRVAESSMYHEGIQKYQELMPSDTGGKVLNKYVQAARLTQKYLLEPSPFMRMEDANWGFSYAAGALQLVMSTKVFQNRYGMLVAGGMNKNEAMMHAIELALENSEIFNRAVHSAMIVNALVNVDPAPVFSPQAYHRNNLTRDMFWFLRFFARMLEIVTVDNELISKHNSRNLRNFFALFFSDPEAAMEWDMKLLLNDFVRVLSRSNVERAFKTQETVAGMNKEQVYKMARVVKRLRDNYSDAVDNMEDFGNIKHGRFVFGNVAAILAYMVVEFLIGLLGQTFRQFQVDKAGRLVIPDKAADSKVKQKKREKYVRSALDVMGLNRLFGGIELAQGLVPGVHPFSQTSWRGWLRGFMRYASTVVPIFLLPNMVLTAATGVSLEDVVYENIWGQYSKESESKNEGSTKGRARRSRSSRRRRR